MNRQSLEIERDIAALWDRLVGYGVRGGLSRSAAEDAAGDTTLYVLAHRDEYTGKGFEKWVFGIAWRKVSEYKRRARRAATEPEFDENAHPGVDGGFAEVADKLTVEDLRAQIEALVPREQARALFALAEEGKAVDAAEVLGIDAALVRKRVQRARATLTQVLPRGGQ